MDRPETPETRASLVDLLIEVERANDDFLRAQRADLLHEIIELVNDAIDCVRLIDKERFAQSAMTFFLGNVLMPQSNGLYVTLLTGNLPMCFATLRLLVETLAKSYYADASYSSSFFGDKLDQIEKGAARVSTTAIIRKVDEMAGTGEQLTQLWTELSNEWIHARGLASGLVDHISEKGFPNWGIILPSEYGEADLKAIDELTEKIGRFRTAMGLLIQDWQRRSRGG